MNKKVGRPKGFISERIGFVGLLAILFIGLKLTNYIDWSWWWVLSPLWITGMIITFILMIVLVIYLVTK